MKYALLLSTLVFGACVGSELPGPPIQNTPDAFVETFFDAPAPPPDMGPAAGCVDKTATVLPAYIHNGAAGAVGTMAGEGCVKSGCHRYGATTNQAPEFIFGGTLYKPGGFEPDPGVTIVVYPDGAGALPINMVSDTAGNFYMRAAQGGGGLTALGGVGPALPASAAATACPTLVKGHLSGKLAANGARDGGNCNGCHATEVATGTQSAIHY